MSDEAMSTALEANVKVYGESLTGIDFIVDENSGVTLRDESTGAYHTVYGEDYKFTTTVKSENEVSLEDVTLDDITEAKNFIVEVKTEDGKVVATNITVVKIKDFWYGDNTTVDTTSLYIVYK